MKTYEAVHEPTEKYTLHIKTDGAMWFVTCDQERGAILAGPSLSPLMQDFEKVVHTLQRLDGR